MDSHLAHGLKIFQSQTLEENGTNVLNWIYPLINIIISLTNSWYSISFPPSTRASYRQVRETQTSEKFTAF